MSCDQADPAQLDRALWRVQEDLGPYLPQLTYWDWRQALYRIRPDLRIIDHGAALTYQSQTELTHYLQAVHGPGLPEQAKAPAQLNCYLAEKLLFCTAIAQSLLRALPQLDPTSTLHQLLTELAAVDPHVQRVCAEISWPPKPAPVFADATLSPAARETRR